MRPIRITMPVLTNDADGICTSQSPVGAGALTLNGVLVSGGVASTTNATAQPVSITSSGNDSGVTFTVVGIGPDGHTVTEAGITGPNTTTVTTTYAYKQVNSVSISGAATGNITVGWEATSGMTTPTIPLDVNQNPFNVTLQFDLRAGTMTVDAEYTLDNPWSTTNGLDVDGVWTVVTGLDDKTADAVSNFAFPVTAVRFRQTVGSATGAAQCTVIQTGL